MKDLLDPEAKKKSMKKRNTVAIGDRFFTQ